MSRENIKHHTISVNGTVININVKGNIDISTIINGNTVDINVNKTHRKNNNTNYKTSKKRSQNYNEDLETRIRFYRANAI